MRHEDPLPQPSVPPPRQLHGDAVEQAQQRVAVGGGLRTHLDADQERDTLAVDVHPLERVAVGAGLGEGVGRHPPAHQEEPQVVLLRRPEHEVGSGVEQLAQDLFVAAPALVQHVHLAVHHDDDTIVHLRPLAAGCHARGMPVADSPERARSQPGGAIWSSSDPESTSVPSSA